MADSKKTVPTKTVVKESVETFASDYKYVTPNDIKEITKNHLAKLEAELHSLRMAFVANGKNPHIMVAPNRTVGEEMAKLESIIAGLETYFSEILEDEDNLG